MSHAQHPAPSTSETAVPSPARSEASPPVNSPAVITYHHHHHHHHYHHHHYNPAPVENVGVPGRATDGLWGARLPPTASHTPSIPARSSSVGTSSSPTPERGLTHSGLQSSQPASADIGDTSMHRRSRSHVRHPRPFSRLYGDGPSNSKPTPCVTAWVDAPAPPSVYGGRSQLRGPPYSMSTFASEMGSASRDSHPTAYWPRQLNGTIGQAGSSSDPPPPAAMPAECALDDPEQNANSVTPSKLGSGTRAASKVGSDE